MERSSTTIPRRLRDELSKVLDEEDFRETNAAGRVTQVVEIFVAVLDALGAIVLTAKATEESNKVKWKSVCVDVTAEDV